jgi:hypothetical protein
MSTFLCDALCDKWFDFKAFSHTGNHLAEHEMTQHAKAESEAPTFYIDTDYASFGNQPNYLDPVCWRASLRR